MTGFRRDNKKTKFVNSYKQQETVESHDCQSPEQTWHIEEFVHE